MKLSVRTAAAAMTTAAQMIADFEANIAAMESARLRNTIASHTFVVIAHGNFALDFDFADNGDGTRTATNPRMIALQKARQFTRKDATTLANSCTDGGGRKARAMYINDAINLMQGELRAVIETLRQHAKAA